ncbi:hypothetical protein TL16_g00315 [Triparma laevis f. inornata]|uniref:START domain-containing protein n=1 Tax=Triparma laevis f. inornata TaxID=1714386 RepID=A0A9W6ZEB1_9STRA|nr:hypothetical protein TL16_g00315 [Triparma laevis f. inornata]
MDIAKEVLAASDSLDWAFVASKRDVSIFSRQVADESVQQVKAVTVINAGMENILSHLTNPNRRRGKKDAVFESKLISSDESTNSQVLYRAQKMPWPLKVRDFVLNSRVIRKTNETAIWAVWSTTHPDYPVRDERIRAWCKISSWIISPITSYKSNVIYIAQVDLQGSNGNSYGWKPLSKNSREYFQEIVNKDGATETLDRKSTNSGDSKEYKWKKLKKSSREYFKDMFGSKMPWGDNFDPSDYERTPPASPAIGDEGGAVGRDVVEASLSLPKLVKNMGLGRRNSSDRGLGIGERRPSVSSDVVSVRSLKAISPSTSRGGSRDYGSGGSKYRERKGGEDGKFFAYDNPKSDMSAGGYSNYSAHSGHSSGGLYQLADRKASEEFDRLFEDCSIEVAKSASKGERADKELTKERSLIYGEVEPATVLVMGGGRGSREYSSGGKGGKLEPIGSTKTARSPKASQSSRRISRHRKLNESPGKDEEESKNYDNVDEEDTRSPQREGSTSLRRRHRNLDPMKG